ncbi:MAG: response regulator, partial [Thiotrichaceae bacterium]|nr:response regulator [Thiotrichaceae bacterium]
LKTLYILFKDDYNVHTAMNGYEALDIIKKETVHVIISDQRMPKMRGTELLHQVKQISPNTVRLLLTGYSEVDGIITAVNEAEIFRYISKPWDFDEIQNRILLAAQIGMKLYHHTTAPLKQEDLKILVIDDNVETYNILAEQGNIVKRCATLESACDIIANQEDLAIIISDLIVDGDDMTLPLKALKQARPEIVTIILTEMQDVHLLIELINQAQIFRFLPKPIRKSLLESTVNTAIQHYLAMQQHPELLARYNVEMPLHLTYFNKLKDLFAK